MGQKQPIWHADALECVRSLRNGGVILHATDTVWGLAADACNADAVSRIFSLKQRALSETLLMLVDSEGMLAHILPNLPDAAWELLEVSDRPVTLVGQLNPQCRFDLASGLVRSDGSVAVRWVQDPYLAFMGQGLGRPLASTSANLSGEPTPVGFKQVSTSVVQGVDYVGSYKQNEPSSHAPSMLVHFDEQGRIQILRS